MKARDLFRLRGSHEAPRLHHAARRHGGHVAARRTPAAARTQRRIAILPIRKAGAATQRSGEGSGPPEKVFNELWKPSRGRLGARRGCKVLDDHKAVDLSLQVGV